MVWDLTLVHYQYCVQAFIFFKTQFENLNMKNNDPENFRKFEKKKEK